VWLVDDEVREITYQPTFEDLGAVGERALGRKYLLIRVLIPTLLAGLVAFTFLKGNNLIGIALLVGLLIGMAIRIRGGSSARLARLGRTMARRDASIAEARVLSFTDEGVSVRIRDQTTTYAWRAIDEMSESRGLLLLGLQSVRQWLAVPVRHFTSDAQLAEFREFVANHLRASRGQPED
jgi:hypothetical protein